MLSHHTRSHHRFHWITAGIVAVLVVFGLGTVASAIVFQERVYPRVTLGARELGGMTYANAQEEVMNAIDELEHASFQFLSDTAQQSVEVSQTGIRIDRDATWDRVWSIGHSKTWWKAFLALPHQMVGTSEPLEFVAVTDEDAHSVFLGQLSRTFGQPMQEHQLEIVHSQIVVRPGFSGTGIDADQMSETLLNHVRSGTASTISVQLTPDHPKLHLSQVRDIAESAQVALDQDVQLTEGDRTWTISKTQIAEWMVFHTLTPDQTGNFVYNAAAGEADLTLAASIDSTQLEAYLVTIAKEINVSPVAQLVRIAQERTDVMEEGSDGHALNVPDTRVRVLQALSNPENRTVQLAMNDVERPILYQENPTSPMESGQVIAIDLSYQMVYGYENGDLLYFAKASTGRAPYYTKTGEFKVYSKTRSQTMSGPGYSLPNVQWSMFYSGDYALHGTYWHNNFGTPMSHGCTNLTNEDAQWFWEWAPIGTPVVVYGQTPV